MQVQRALLTLVIGMGLSGIAWAQAPAPAPTGTSTAPGTTSTATAGTGTTSAAQAPAVDMDHDSFGGAVNQWEASGFVGSNYGAAAQSASADFGGSIGYLWKSVAGLEAVASFAPKFNVSNPVMFAGQNPEVNSFMLNAIGAVPLGADGRFQPFISGGFGAITLRSDALNNGSGNAVSNVFNPDDTRAGGNIGGGIMAYAGAWGIRADVRYFRAFASSNTPSVTAQSTAGTIASAVLPGLNFWHANIGVALRW